MTEFLKILVKLISSLRDNAEAIDDALLRQSMTEALPPLESFVSAAKSLREWEDRHVSAHVKRSHKRAVSQLGPLDPPWMAQEGFREKLGNLTAAFFAYTEALAHIIPRLRAMMPEASPHSAEALQLDRTETQLPDIQGMLTLGYAEMVKWKAAEIGYMPSA